jgi:hypothetical protein
LCSLIVVRCLVVTSIVSFEKFEGFVLEIEKLSVERLCKGLRLKSRGVSLVSFVKVEGLKE